MGKMYLEKIHSEGLAHISYILGHNGEAAVIDPRRDCGVYVDIAHQNGTNITHIFETHRNEDYLIGSRELEDRTGAKIYHRQADHFAYGIGVTEGDAFRIGKMKLTVLETPGHTFDSISLVLADESFSHDPVAVFTGDALFVGDVGRTDFFPDRAEEVAGLLYDSIFNKLLPLGDQVILYPAHGAGSVCGGGLADREFSTLGYERKHNPVLQMKRRDEFIRHKMTEHHYKAPYFEKMHTLNGEGSAPLMRRLPKPKPLAPEAFAKVMEAGTFALDLRSPEAIAGAFIPGSVAMPLEMIPGYAGYFVPYETPIGLIVESYPMIDAAVRYLVRIGIDDVSCFLAGGMTAWEKSGRAYDTIPAIHVDELVGLMESKKDFTLLDVRKIDEVKEGKLPRAQHIFLGELLNRLNEVPRDRPLVAFCDSGRRSMIAASLLKREGFQNVKDCLGSMAACRNAGCPIVREEGRGKR
ncbi:MAG TPA: rhodanese-like domain-containing protein [Thermodesulfobacteriota bacterium]|nr:rhodanese-like domain-containing protein [Thermodesulfobacteriota bacterium]